MVLFLHKQFNLLREDAIAFLTTTERYSKSSSHRKYSMHINLHVVAPVLILFFSSIRVKSTTTYFTLWTYSDVITIYRIWNFVFSFKTTFKRNELTFLNIFQGDMMTILVPKKEKKTSYLTHLYWAIFYTYFINVFCFFQHWFSLSSLWILQILVSWIGST